MPKISDFKQTILIKMIYRLSEYIPILNPKRRFILFSNLEWIFDRLAHEESHIAFGLDAHPSNFHSMEFYLKYVNKSSRVVDLGSGFGSISKIFSEHAKEVLSIEINRTKIEEATRNNIAQNIKFLHMDANEFLKTNHNQFDVLILSHFLEHFEDPKQLLLMCKPFFNHIYIEVPDFDKILLNKLRILAKSNLYFSDTSHFYEFTRSELRHLLEECDLQITDEEHRLGAIRIWCEPV